MTSTTLHLPLSDLNPEAIRDLQEKYPGAQVSVSLPSDHTTRRMEEADFWEIIGLLDWDHEDEDDTAVIAPAVKRLAALSIHYIYDFKNLLSEKLYALDTFQHAQNIGEDEWQEGKYFSVDNFLYARCCVVANGRDFYQQVLKNPAEMPKNMTFEPLLRIAGDAYRKKTGKQLAFVTTYNIETYSNELGWKDAVV